MGHLHSSGWHGVGGLDKAGLMRGSPAKNSTAGACFLCLCILENFLSTHGALCGPTSEERAKGFGTNQENLEDAGDEP